MIHSLSTVREWSEPATHPGLVPCEHRSVARDGRIICAKIAEGDNNVSPSLCRSCPFQAVNCAHLRFSLQHTAPRPLLVRFNGRTELWDDEPPSLRFQQAACAVQVLPIDNPGICATCPQRQALRSSTPPAPARRQRRAAAAGAAARAGKVVPFPGREPVLAG
jgi:hypothetical protein